MNKLTVKLPEWFMNKMAQNRNASADIVGFTDCVTKHFDYVGPCYYVEFPDWNYEGYFKRSDIILVGNKLSVRRK